MTMYRAKKFIRAALDHNPYVIYTDPNVGYPCGGVQGTNELRPCQHIDHNDLNDPNPLFHTEEVTVDPEQLKKEWFRSLIDIYGSIHAYL